MSDAIKHECAVALVALRKDGAYYRTKYGTSDYGGVKLSLLLEKQHNRGQDGAGAAIISVNPDAGSEPYHIFKSASETSLADILGMITKRKNALLEPFFAEHDTDLFHNETKSSEKIFLGHLRYATFGKNEESFCHPFLHTSSELEKTVLLAGNFNLTNAAELFEQFRRRHCFPTSRADGYLVTELVANEMKRKTSIPGALAKALANADGAWTFVGATADATAFALRDPHGIRPGFYFVNDEVVAVASERPAIQAAFDVPPEAVKELPPGEALIVSPHGDVEFVALDFNHRTSVSLSGNHTGHTKPKRRSCVFERIYFSRANDADIHRERKALGAALVPQILKAAHVPINEIFFSYIPNSARIAFHGLLEELFTMVFRRKGYREHKGGSGNRCDLFGKSLPRFGEIAVKDAKFRTFIADAAARREFYKHVYDVTYGLVGKDDTLVVLDDSIVRGNTMKNAILPMLDRLGPKRIIVVSSAPPIRYPDCYGIDMSTLGELVAFRALVNLLGDHADEELRACTETADKPKRCAYALSSLYARFSDEQHANEIARLLTPSGMKAEVSVVYQSIEAMRKACPKTTGDWYFTGDYPTPGGYKVLHTALLNYLNKNSERSY